ncbi:MAG: glycosyltransferase family 9 protein [Deltaproteobacteria bacterium]|nr:glycosyltransferase family 9 protein [Deltaproteobacteria bacterium]
MEGRKKIIAVDFGGVGDLVLSIPFLRGLKQAFPLSEISVLCAERTGMILKEQLYISSLYLSPITLRGLFAIGFQLRKKRLDMAINLMPETSYCSALKIYLLFLLINAKQWVGRDTEGRGFFYDIKIPEPNMQIENEVLMYGSILKAISDGDFDEGLEFHITKKSRKRAGELLSKERNFQRDPLVLINPGSDWPAKRWLIDRYAELVERLAQLFPHVEFGIIGTQGEAELARFIKGSCGERVFILSGKTPLEILPAVIEKASLLITNDSGPAHIARAVGTPVVILAGPSAPAFFTIRGRNETRVIYHPISCAPCLKVSCASMACWKAITVHEVVDVSAKLLGRKINEANS